ncbi:MAG TPA: hypothetical protein VEA40_06745, partial [Ramlibacter sp.]|nr:hypothetical protein [Ramlibacter sp.]
MSNGSFGRRAAIAAIAAAILGGCGGSGGSQQLTLEGLAAVGAALSAANVSVKCVVGSGTATTAADGSFTVTIAPAGIAPCMVQVTKDGVTLHSLATASGR